jgi:hypothetical protein
LLGVYTLELTVRNTGWWMGSWNSYPGHPSQEHRHDVTTRTLPWTHARTLSPL